MDIWKSRVRLQRLLLEELLHKFEDAVTDTFPLKPKKIAAEERKKQQAEAIQAIVEKKPKVQLAVAKAIQEVKSFEPAPYIFVSADGDNIGSTVEQKVMANDLEGIIRQSELIKQGQAYLKSTFETLSGKLLVHGGDDSLAVVGSEHLDKIEKIRQGYCALTNFTITFGVGNTMREAVKAMVYGKLTGKDKLIFWDDSLNEKLQELAHEQTPGEKLTEHGLLPDDIAEKSELAKCEPTEIEGVKEYLVGGHGDGHPASEFDSKEVEMGVKIEMEHTNNPEISEEITRDHLAEIPDYYTRLDAMEEQAKKDGKFREVVKGKPGEKSTIKK